MTPQSGMSPTNTKFKRAAFPNWLISEKTPVVRGVEQTQKTDRGTSNQLQDIPGAPALST